MKDGSVVTCRKCGTKHYMKADGSGDIMPVYCCGEKLEKPAKKTASTTSSTTKGTKKK